MLRLLDFVSSVLKYCLLLTLARLVGAAFGLEFGISRQYLRLLAWFLDRGQERIERCESEQRLRRLSSSGILNQKAEAENSGQVNHQLSNGDDDDDDVRRTSNNIERPHTLTDSWSSLSLLSSSKAAEGKDEETNAPVQRRRRVGITFSQAISPLRPSSEDRLKHLADSRQTSGHLQNKKRRVSTPDGPPVFLLDGLSDDDDEDKGCGEDATSSRLEGTKRVSVTTSELSSSSSSSRLEQQVAVAEDVSGAARHVKRHEFHLEDAALFVVKGVSAIIDDEVTKRFTPEQLKSWNLLTRTNAKNYQFMSRSLGLCWLFGLVIRYAILMPLRTLFTLTGFLWLIVSMSLIGLLPRKLRDAPYRLSSLMAFRMLSCGITSRLKFHNRQWRAQKGDICVANHTSPLDVVLLACDNCYALVGQRHGGLLGILELALSRATNHVWFDRSESRDRKMVTERLSAHVARKSNLPVLIFPEGTCINNSAVMRFSKGIFGLETTARVCPVAIKYDPRYGDPFWCSSKQSYLQYLLMMMSSWAIKCEVWYLPPMERLEGESSAEFANRVKSEIARQGGLEDLAWDGQLKRTSVKPTWLYQQQEDYAKRLKLE